MNPTLHFIIADLDNSGLQLKATEFGQADKWLPNPAVKPSDFLGAKVWAEVLPAILQKGLWTGTVEWSWEGRKIEAALKGFRLAGEPGQVLLLPNADVEHQSILQKINRMSQLVAVGEVASGIAHEINTPLAILSGKLALIKRAASKNPIELEKLNSNCEQGEDVVKRIAAMVKGIRSLSKAGASDPFVKVDMATIIENLKPICEDKAIRLGVQLKFDGPTCELSCREVQISQVLLNLINNSFDALESQPTKTIQVTWALVQSQVEIRVTDSGPRISDELADKILQPYFTTKAAGKGTGIGLSLSQTIISQHGGTFQLNRENPTMQFVIGLPLTQP